MFVSNDDDVHKMYLQIMFFVHENYEYNFSPTYHAYHAIALLQALLMDRVGRV